MIDARNISNEYPFPGGNSSVGGRPTMYPFASMAIGDSFPVLANRLKNVRNSVCQKNKKSVEKFKVDKIVRKGITEWRCWRIA